ncbi:MAG: EI24 domain-containing protein [Bdellovibrionales bacterium]|nr:EI24 domain-containing protein [Bdellovibrionales bacterium]
MTRAIAALLQGCWLCFTERNIRRLALRPVLAAAVVYLSLISLGGYYLSAAVDAIVGTPSGFWSELLWWVAAVGLGLTGSAVAFFGALAGALLVAALYEGSIAEEVYRKLHLSVPAASGGTARELSRQLSGTVFTLLWTTPLIVLASVLGFFPPLTPVSVLLVAWLLGFQALDIALDGLRFSGKARLGFALQHKVAVLLFGLTLAAAGLIPFFAILLTAPAIAGAAWLAGPAAAQQNIASSS